MTATVLVGVDGSESARTALDWAAAEAGRLDAVLVVCTVANDDMLTEPGLWTTPQLVRRRGEDIVDAAVRRARDAVPDLRVSRRLLVGDAAEQLRSESAHVDLVVLGCRGLGAFLGLLLGSVSERVALHASCPTVVVRGDPGTWNGPVLLGVDGDQDAAPAVEFAFAAAERRGADLIVLTAAPPIWSGGPAAAVPEQVVSPTGVDAILRDLQDDAVRVAAKAHPGVRVVHRTVQAPAARSLIDASSGCGLAVLGTRAHRGVGLVGSVTGHVLRHAHCPVAVVRV